jgi:hypothetical protein
MFLNYVKYLAERSYSPVIKILEIGDLICAKANIT